ncbi:hypothetical protein HK100_002809, partial [Physocladia obscura]
MPLFQDQHDKDQPLLAQPAESDPAAPLVQEIKLFATSPADPMDLEPSLPQSLPNIDAILAPPAAGLTVEASMIHRWDITNWKSIRSTKKSYSPEFVFNGSKWRILLFPNGNNNTDALSVFLDSVDAADHASDDIWHLCIQFAIAISNPDDDEVYKHNGNCNIKKLREATYNIPTDKDEPTKSIPLALQRIFYQLQFSDDPVGTIELTKSFGWDAIDSFMQHDVQEFNRVLQDNLESKMKGTKAEGAISRLFVGKYKSYIKCINVSYESSRIEDFADIQLNVKGCKNVYESFVEYVNVETLDGENKYMAEGHGLQDARKGVIFSVFPPVLHLQLKRYEYDVEKDAMVKINDRYEFPKELDLEPFLDESSEQKKKPQKYLLHGVLVHAGDFSGGHYCAFLRAENNGKWFKFDDDHVTPVSEYDAMEENFGSDAATKTRLLKKFTNAYMLVYVRESNADEILKPITAEDIPAHLRRRFDEEKLASEQKRKDKEEQHLYFNTRYITDADIKLHGGFDLCNFDNKDLPLSAGHVLRVKKDEKFGAYRARLAETLDVPVENVKVWNMVFRQNKTVRVDSKITDDEKTLEQMRDSVKAANDFRFYVDTEDEVGVEIENDSIIIFIKKYDPVFATIRYVGRAFFSPSQRISEALPAIVKLADLQTSNVGVYEEVKPTMIDPCTITNTFSSSEIGNGDILCIQEILSEEDVKQLPDPRLATVTFYFDDYRNRLPITFKHKHDEKEMPIPDIELVLSKKITFDAVVAKLGPAVKHDAAKIQLYSLQGHSTRSLIKRSPTLTLQEMTNPGYYAQANNYNTGPSVLFYELLDIPLVELDSKRFVNVVYVDRQMHEHGPIKILVAKNARAGEFLEILKPKLVIADGGSGKLRLFEVNNFRTYKVFSESDFVSSFNDFTTLYAE